jgi:lycopene beta-cyclase
MLFKATEPERRVGIFEMFYKNSQELIERFYAGQTTMMDRMHILTGKPPVSIARAVRALVSKGKPLSKENSE